MDAPTTPEQAEAVLSQGFAINRAMLANLVIRTGQWPDLCKLVNGALRLRAARGGGIAEAIGWAESLLDSGRPDGWDLTDSTTRDIAIGTVIRAILTLIADGNPGAVDRYRELGVFPIGADVPMTTLVRYWRRTGGIDRQEAEQLCHAYAEAYLVDDFQLDPPRLRLRDAIAGYLRRDGRRHAIAWHRALLDSYRTDLPAAGGLPTAWWRLPADEPYLWRHLAGHLRDAGCADELTALLRDLRWASVKVHRLGAASAEADAAVSSGNAHAHALGQLLRGTSHLYQPGDPMMMNIATFAAYAAGDRVLGATAIRLLGRITGPHLRPTASGLPDHPHPSAARILAGHVVAPHALAVAPDTTWLASAGYADPVRVWHPDDGTEIFSLPMPEKGAWALAVAPDGSWLASGGGDGVVRVWNMPDGTERATLTGHTDAIWALAVAPDGTWLASGGDDDAVRVWNMPDGTPRALLPGCTSRVEALAVAPGGSWLAVASKTNPWACAWVWRLADGARLSLDTDDAVGSARALAVAPDGSWLAGAAFEHVYLWNPVDGRLLRTLEGHSRWVSALAVAPDGSWLASGGEDTIVRLWDPVTGGETGRLAGHTGQVNALAVAPDGSWLASAAGDTLRNDDNTVRVWDVADRTARAVLTGHSGDVAALAAAPDGSWVASAGNDGTVRLWNTTDGTERAVLHGHRDCVSSLVVAADGSWLASAGHDGTVRLWNTADGTARAVLAQGIGLVSSLVAVPDDSRLAAGCEDTLRLWDPDTGRQVAPPRSCETPVTLLAVGGDGSWLAGAGLGGIVRLWDPADGADLGTVPTGALRVDALASAPDGSWIANTGKGYAIEVRNVDGWTPKAVLRGHTDGVLRLAVAPDGSWLASVGRDGTARVWNAANGDRQAVVRHSGITFDIAVAPDGTWLASVGGDGAVRVFDPFGDVWASIRVDSQLNRCVVNPARPQLVVAGSRHIYFLDVRRG